MRRSITATILIGLILIFSFCVSANEFSDELALVDVALNKPVYTTSDSGYETGDKTYLVDNETGGNATYWKPATSSPTEKAIVDLTQQYSINRIELIMTGKRSFNVAVSNDMDTWITVHTQGGTAFEGDKLVIYPSLGKKYRYVRIARSLGPGMSDDFKVSSLRVYAPCEYKLEEVAAGQPVTTHTNGANYEKGENVVDRDYNSMIFAAKTSTHSQYFTIDLGTQRDVKRVELMQAMKDTSYFNNGVQPDGQAMREGWGSAIYRIYMSDEDVTPDVFTESAEKVAEYGAVQNWGVAHSITAFDIEATKPYRYVHVVAVNLSSAFRIAEAFVYAKQEVVSQVSFETENIFFKKPVEYKSGSSNPEYCNDSDETTAWIIDSHTDYATFKLNGAFSIQSINLLTEALPDSFEIWGGREKIFETDNTKVRLFSGNSLSESTQLSNVVQYITIKPSAEAVLPVSLNEVEAFAEKGIRLSEMEENVIVSEAALKDGLFDAVKTENASVTLGGSEAVSSLQIFFGDTNEGKRNIKVFGGLDEDNLVEIASLGKRSLISDAPYTITLNEEQADYRYFSVSKEKAAISGGANVNGVYSFFETDSTVEIEEILIYKKIENILPPTSDLKVKSASAVDGDGNLITELSLDSCGAALSLENCGESVEKAVVICAAVDENNMVVKCSMVDVELLSGEKKDISVLIEDVTDDACGLKVFIWHNIGANQVPHTVHKTLIWEE